MANRHLSRSVAMQTLFERDFNHIDDRNVIETLLDRNAKEFAPGMGDLSFARFILDRTLKYQGKIDAIIEKAAPDWPIEKISIVDRNILRIGLAELLYGNRSEVPAKVAINEAIELAKQFGGENSGKFINGVLGAVYKELGEDVNDKPRVRGKRGVRQETDPAKMPQEKLVGAVVYAKEKDNVYLALVHDIFGHWTLSKGHLAEGENEEAGVTRVIKEEIGVDIKVKEKLGSNEYIASNPEKGKLRKQVNYFIVESPFNDLKLEKTGGLDDVQWFKMVDILELNIYDDILPLITKAITILLKK